MTLPTTVFVIVAGLDMDYKGNPFGPMPNLMATAEYVTKSMPYVLTLAIWLSTVSVNPMTIIWFLGQTGEYEPLSRAAYYHAMSMNWPPKKANSRKVNKKKKSG